MRKFLLLLLVTTSFFAQSQSVNGYWYGKAAIQNGGNVNTYLIELIIDQKNATTAQAIKNKRNCFNSPCPLAV